MRFLRLLPVALLTGFLSLHGAAFARAATVAPFTEQAFKSAQADGQPILVDISATWCPTCTQQKSIIDSLAATPGFEKLVILHVDFDTQKDVVRAQGLRTKNSVVLRC